jgi:pyruvate ferredoxin oxidoreductase alpha subunit
VVAFCRIDDREIRLREPILAPDVLIVQDPTLLHQVDVFQGLKPDGYVLINSRAASTTWAGRDRPALPPRAADHRAGHRDRAQAPGPPAAQCGAAGRVRGAVRLITLDAVAHAIRHTFRAVAEGNVAAAAEAFAYVQNENWRSWPMLKQIEGSHAVAEAVALAARGDLRLPDLAADAHRRRPGRAGEERGAEPCEFINVESEFAAMSVAIGSSAAGARTYTATASQGLLFMAEAVYNASGLGLPIVMTVANRAIGAPINIWNDHSDSMSQRDCGWIQLFAEPTRKPGPAHPGLQAGRGAEHAGDGVHGRLHPHARLRAGGHAQQAEVDAFLPPYEPRQVLDPAEPVSIGAMVGPEAFMEVRYLAHAKQTLALERIPQIAAEFAGRFGRTTAGLVRTYHCRGRRDHRRGAGLGAGHAQGHGGRDARDGIKHRRAGHPLLPPLPAGGGARRAAGRQARGGAGKELLGRPGRRGVHRRAPGAVGPAAARLHRGGRPGRARHHQGLAGAHAARGHGRQAGAADLPGPGLAHRQRQLEREAPAMRRSGPIAENLLRDWAPSPRR